MPGLKSSDLIPAVIGLLLGAAGFHLFSLAPHLAATVAARAINGNTIELARTGERLRLVNIDAPETRGRSRRCKAEGAVGELAKNEMIGLLAGGAVEVHRTGDKDKSGTARAYVIVGGKDVGQLLIDRGLARPWRGRHESWCDNRGKLLPAS